jgi:hypothetical protein
MLKEHEIYNAFTVKFNSKVALQSFHLAQHTTTSYDNNKSRAMTKPT